MVEGGSGNYSYEWKDGPSAQDRSGLGAGTYSLIINDINVCSNGENVYMDFELREPPRENWSMQGNAGTDPNNQFIGTLDNISLAFKTNNTERMRINGNGNVGIGINLPTEKLHVVGNGKITDNFKVGKKMNITGSLKIDSLGGVGYKFDSLSTKSYRIVYVDETGQFGTFPPRDEQSCGEVAEPWYLGGNRLGLPGQINFAKNIGTCDHWPFDIKTNNVFRMRISADGNVGIGTYTPNDKLQIGEGNASISFGSILNASFGNFMGYQGINASRNINSQNWTISGGSGGAIFTADVTGTIMLIPIKNAQGGLTLSDEDIQKRRVVQIGAGTINTDNKLVDAYMMVNGNIIAKEVEVKIDGWWPDFVFEKKYDLMPLAEVEQYINEHKHLPSVPSASEVETNGVALGQNQAILLQKIEELTLYVIELNKKNEQLQKEVTEMKKSK
jgi:hypothetical protein